MSNVVPILNKRIYKGSLHSLFSPGVRVSGMHNIKSVFFNPVAFVCVVGQV